MKQHVAKGFTLIEVLLALVVIAIALTALLKATSQNIENTQRLKEKSISHWIAMHAVALIQLNLITLTPSYESTQMTPMMDKNWYWRVKINKTPSPKIQKLTVYVSGNQSGPFRQELQAWRYVP